MVSALIKNVNIAKPNAVAAAQQNALWAQLSSLTNTIANAHNAGHQATHFAMKTIPTKSAEDTVSFVKITHVVRNISDGSFHSTGNPYDCALTGKGKYFAVQAPQGIRWARGGQFTTDQEGVLRTASTGYKVLNSGGGEIAIPQNAQNINISRNGNIFADDQFIARLGVFHFDNPQKLKNEGYNLLNHSEEPEIAEEGSYNIVQGGYEESNMSPAEAGLELIKVMRLYDTTEKFVKAYGKAHEAGINVKSA